MCLLCRKALKEKENDTDKTGIDVTCPICLDKAEQVRKTFQYDYIIIIISVGILKGILNVGVTKLLHNFI